MSKNALLTIEEQAMAAGQGWWLSHVFDLASDKWRVMVLGIPSAEAAGQMVVARARSGDALCQKALGLVMNSYQGK